MSGEATNGLSEVRALPVRYVFALGGLLLTMNGMLLYQNYTLRDALTPPEIPRMEVGEELGSFRATDLSGRALSFGYDGSGPGHIFLFFSPTCRFCIAQEPLWRELLDEIDTNRFTVLGLANGRESADAIGQYVTSAGYANLEVALLDDDVLREYKLYSTPITLAVSNQGIVLGAWRGLWDAESTGAVAELLGIEFDSVPGNPRAVR